MLTKIFKKRKKRKKSGDRTLKNLRFKFAFTLAELLMSLTIVGVISALTIPVIVNASYNRVYDAGLKKAIIVLDEALDMARLEPKFQPAPRCFYWAPGKRPSWMCNGGGAKTYVNTTTGEKYWRCADGSNLPSNWNGEFSQCTALLEWLVENMRTVKKCSSNGYANGCMPKYKGNDQVYKDKNQNASDMDAVTASSGCGGWRGATMLGKYSWVTSDGMIFFPYDKNWPGAAIIAVDVNGKKGPNKWGYDVFPLQLVGDPQYMTSYSPGGCEFIEKGGKSGAQILKGK